MRLRPEVKRGWGPGGWIFYQPELNWSAPNPLQNNFEQQVANIIKVRKANPQAKLSTDYDTVAQELEAFTCRRLHNHPKWCIDGPIEAPAALTMGAQKKTLWPRILRPHSPEPDPVAEEKGHANPDALLEWLGAGLRPVALPLAESRSEICATCPENSSSPTCDPARRLSWRDWWTGAAAKGLRALMGIRENMDLSLTRDPQLGKCLACRCELKLKPFTPIEHILDTTSAEELSLLDPRCWVLQERDQSK